MSFTTAFVNGKQVIARFTPWNEITEPYKLSKSKWDDLHANVLTTILADLPKQTDEKHRMALAQSMTDGVMAVVGKAVTE